MPRAVPEPGMAAEIVHFGAVEAATVVAVDGAAVTVEAAGGEVLVFELNRLTAHFTLAGGSYYGPRLRLVGAP